MDRNVMIERLRWLALAGPHSNPPEWLAPNVWAQAIAEVAAEALDEIEEKDRILVTWAVHGPQVAWRPIDEAPIPDHELVPIYWLFPCMIQDEAGVVYAGFARYANTNARGRSPRVLRWYEGVSQRYAQILKPRYYQPLPQPRKD